jgi:ethanolamine-phosphate cytidylyltransferase
MESFMKLTPPTDDQKIVYVCGSFDLLHPGHIEFLKQARALGEYLIVGVQNDEVNNKKFSSNFLINLRS